ncbi:hypothetical protein N836_17570 [Leptolyngbya sp. Heron Island J]|uniref:hypothetical protein n=1 Tax=Leptolyngbya sp. Heron Island J TaxID=1385935 RepID=UPI0003B94AE4|nr:hypothetical protein [Leptolyngbya sp. Heron Island J]ESA34434.1 hypothetical protein N836_17570 [Leptolyngbya sp. Heron Island J]
MDIEKQIQTLIDEAPDQITGEAIALVAPLLKEIAEQLPTELYYVLQSLGQGWVMTTLRGRQDPKATKTVVYAYPSLEAAALSAADNPQMMALPHPSTHLLFQLLSLKQVDSIIFMQEKGKGQSVEVPRAMLEQAMRSQLQQLKAKGETPTDIA